MGVRYNRFPTPNGSHSGSHGIRMKADGPFIFKIGAGMNHAPHDVPLLRRKPMGAGFPIDNFKT
jgi:hypothetical protein